MASVFKQLGQISMVVEDVMETAKIWNDEYGIGPWGFLHFTEENMTSMSVHGKNVPYAMDIALCNMHPNIEIELIAPKDDRSIYAEFLREHGPGIHHIAFVTPHGTFNVAKEMLERKGIEHAQGGKDPMGQEFAYYNLCKQLGCFIELNDRPDDFHPLPPEEQYPEK